MHVRRTGHETVPKVIVPTYEFAQVAFRYKRYKPLYHLYIERETCIRLYILYIRHVSRVEIAERKKKKENKGRTCNTLLRVSITWRMKKVAGFKTRNIEVAR